MFRLPLALLAFICLANGIVTALPGSGILAETNGDLKVPIADIEYDAGLFFGANYSLGYVGFDFNADSISSNALSPPLLNPFTVKAIAMRPGIEVRIYQLTKAESMSLSSVLLNETLPFIALRTNFTFFNATLLGFDNGTKIAISIVGTECSAACSSSGLCNPTTNTCQCSSNFVGENCGDCAAGYYGSRCESKCNCATSHGATCDDGKRGTGQCSCTVGEYNTGPTCQDCMYGYANVNHEQNCIYDENGGWGYCEPICRQLSNACDGIATAASDLIHCAAPLGYYVDQELRYSNKTMCEVGYYYDTTYNQCRVCMYMCKTCRYGDGICDSCHDTYSLFGIDLGVTLIRGGCMIKDDSSDIFQLTPICLYYNVTDAHCNACIGSSYCLMNAWTWIPCTTGENNRCTFPLRLIFAVQTSFPDNLVPPVLTVEVDSGWVVQEHKHVTYSNRWSPGGGIPEAWSHHLEVCPRYCRTCRVKEGELITTTSVEYTYILDQNIICLSCMHEFTLVNNSCVRVEDAYPCDVGMFMDYQTNLTSMVDISYKCQPCHSSCETCYASGSDQCKTCPPGAILNGRTCIVQSCPDTSKPYNIDGTCVGCDPSCATCSGHEANQCTSCNSPYALVNGVCTLSCPAGQYVANDKGKCEPCLDLCGFCSSASTCNMCYDGYSFNGTSCIPTSYGSLVVVSGESEKSSKSSSFPTYAIVIIIVACLLIFILAAALFIRHLRRQNMLKGAQKRMEGWEREVAQYKAEVLDQHGDLSPLGDNFMAGGGAVSLRPNAHNDEVSQRKVSPTGNPLRIDTSPIARFSSDTDLASNSPLSAGSDDKLIELGTPISSPLSKEVVIHGDAKGTTGMGLANNGWDEPELLVFESRENLYPPMGYKRRTIPSVTQADIIAMKKSKIAFSDWQSNVMTKFLINGSTCLRQGELLSRPSPTLLVQPMVGGSQTQMDERPPIRLGVLSRNIMESKQVVIVPFGRSDSSLGNDNSYSTAQVKQVVQVLITLSSCSNIAAFIGYTLEPSVNLVMEYYEGDLDFVLSNPHYQLTMERTREIMMDVSRGISELHKLGFSHGRLRPKAILLQKSPLVNNEHSGASFLQKIAGKVVDNTNKFRWIARVSDLEAIQLSAEEMQTVVPDKRGGVVNASGIEVNPIPLPEACLCPRYAAPESLGSMEARTLSEDCWAIGSLTYHCVTRKQPYENAFSNTEVVRRVRSGELPGSLENRSRDPKTPEGALVSLIRHCWVPDPQERPSVADIVLAFEFMEDRFNSDL